MRIAVTYENGEVFQHFGHTEQFKLYDIQETQIVKEQIIDASGSGHGALAGFLTENGVDTLDLRPVFREEAEKDPLAVEEHFFHTDHHWTPAGAFLGYQTLCEKLRKDYRFQMEKEWTDQRQFDRYVFEDAFLGSQGRRV